ncbi:hypothetical protein C0992_011142 [Termitomyces sp. T32_za158]|nr:hypothetical protein C0992_011142 [Termitomyces sp. T32_za158]
MQVDSQQAYSFPASLTDLADIFNPDAFADDLANAFVNVPNSSNSPPTASSSRGSSPYLSSIQTPPQPPAFPDYTPSSFFGLDDDLQTKQYDSMMNIPNNSYDFFTAFEGVDMGIDSGLNMEMAADISGINTGIVGEAMGIDPQLVGTPSAHSDIDEQNEDIEHDGDVSASPSSSGSPPATTTAARKVRSAKRKEREVETEEDREKLTLVIQPVKAGGHGKARKGTIQSGGIVKKTPSSNPVTASLGKENTYTPTTIASFVASATYTPPSAFQPTNLYNNLQSQEKKDDKDDEDDELPQDWRPSPEVLAKMTSKEKRQLRNKISARNFRVRRKEYISTLEGDIAERDRLLEAIRSELGSTQSENLALRQEIAALKRTLLEGRAPTSAADGTSEFPLLNLPPPAPLPAQSAAATLQAQAQAQAQAQQQPQAQPQPLLTPNTQKDTTKNGRFWGGVRIGMGMGGITPVHRVVLPEMSVVDLFANQFGPSPFVVQKDDKWKENVNPLLNELVGEKINSDKEKEKEKEREKERERIHNHLGFEGFTDVNPFTMKTLDAYRMHLWSKMASQQQFVQHQQNHLQQQQSHANPHLTNLASQLRPAFFTSPNAPASPLASLLSGKHMLNSPAPPYSPPPPPYTSPPSSPLLVGKGGVMEKLERERREKEREREMQKEREKKETAMYAAIASQTLLRKLGHAFWDAFAGSSGSSSGSGSSSNSGLKPWDADKVRKVLEGTAVVKVVDVEEVKPQQEKEQVQTQQKERKCLKAAEELLEQSMRSLTLNKKS